MDPIEALRQFISTGSAEAFAALTTRYVDLVYAAARRQVADAHLAEDVTQAVFIILAKKARSIPQDRPLGAWLLRTTAYVAANARRMQAKRQVYERRAAQMAITTDQGPSTEQRWQELSPLLDQGINRLPSKYREPLILRYFESMNLREVGEALGISEVAATKRVSRAVEKLRQFLQRQGVTVSDTALSGLLATSINQPAPAALASHIVAGGATAKVSSISLLKGTILIMAMEKLKIGAVAILVVLLCGVGGVVAIKKSGSNPAPEVAATSASTTRVALEETNFRVVFPSGALVEVLGIRDESTPDGPWWGADGLPCVPPVAPDNRRIIPEIPHAKRFICRITGGSLPDKQLNVKILPSDRNVDAIFIIGRDTSLYTMVASIPEDRPTVDLRVMLSEGAWNNEVIYDSNSTAPAISNLSGAKVESSSEENGETVVNLTFPPGERYRQERLMLRSSNGIEQFPYKSTSPEGKGTYYFKTPKAQVSAAMFRWRPYTWIDIKNVSVMPQSMPTAVEATAAQTDIPAVKVPLTETSP